MAKTPLIDPDSREHQDERYDPAQHRYDREFNDRIKSGVDNDDTSDDAPHDQLDDKDSNELAKQEDSASAPERASADTADVSQQENQPSSAVGSIPFTPASAIKKGLNRKKKGVIGGIVAFVIALGAFLGLIVPNFAIVNLKEVAVNKFVKDQLATYEPRAHILMRYKTVPNNAPDTTNGCAIKVKCRFKGTSTKGVEKLRTAGFTVESAKIANHPLGYERITKLQYEVNGKLVDITAAEYQRAVRTNPKFNQMIHQAYKSKAALHRDKLARTITNKLGIYRGNQLADARDKKTLMQKFRTSISGRTLDVHGRVIVGPNDTQADVERRTALLGEAAQEVTEEAQQRATDFLDPEKALSSVPDVDGKAVVDASDAIKAAGDGAIKGALLGPINTASNICGLYYMIGAVGFGAKVVANEQLIRYFYTFNNTADVIKAGKATPEQTAFLGDIFTLKDEKGRALPDSFGYNYMAYNKLGDSTETHKYKLGGGLTGSLIGIKNMADDFGGGKTCGVVSNPFVQGAGFIAYILSVPFSGGASLAASAAGNAALAGALAVAQVVITPMLVNLVAGTIVSGDENGKDAGNAYTAGGGAFAALSGRNRALVPQTKAEAAAYLQQSQQTIAMYEAAEREQADFFDVTNPYSPTGGAFATIAPYALNPVSINTSMALTKLAANPLSMFSSVGNSFSTPANAQVSEFEICTDPEYLELNLATDPFCNPKYGFRLRDIENPNNNPDAVIDYMLANELIDEDGNPMGAYQTFIKDCLENTSPLSPNEGDQSLPTYCFEERYTPEQTMMRIYFIDSTIHDGIQEQMDEKEMPAEGGQATTESGSVVTGAPGDAVPSGKGWSIERGKDYTGTPCAPGTTEKLIYNHPTEGYRIRICDVANGIAVNSMWSAKVKGAIDAAAASGVRLAGSGWRSYERQIELRRINGCSSNPTAPSSTCRVPTAPPGNSMHEKGLAIDISGRISRGTPQFDWLAANGAQYDLINWPREPWHWSTNGN